MSATAILNLSKASPTETRVMALQVTIVVALVKLLPGLH